MCHHAKTINKTIYIVQVCKIILELELQAVINEVQRGNACRPGLTSSPGTPSTLCTADFKFDVKEICS